MARVCAEETSDFTTRENSDQADFFQGAGKSYQQLQRVFRNGPLSHKLRILCDKRLFLWRKRGMCLMSHLRPGLSKTPCTPKDGQKLGDSYGSVTNDPC